MFEKKHFKILFGSVIVLSLGVFLFRLGSEAFIDYDEATYAHVISTTVASGNMLSLKIDAERYWFEKPPLYFWLSAATAQIVPAKTWAYRLPDAILAVCAIALTMLITYELGANISAVLLSGLILLTTGAWFEAGRQLRMDVPVTTFILFSFYTFLRGEKNPRWYLGVGVGIGLGVMMKSVIGLFAIPIIFIWAFVTKKWEWFQSAYFWIGAGLGLIIALPWHIYQSVRFGGAFWNNYLGYHILQRFSKNILGGKSGSILLVWNFLSSSLLWVYAFFAGIVGSIWLFKKGEKERKQIFAVALITLFILGVFMCSRTKLLYYLTPTYPFIAIFLALFFSKAASIQNAKKIVTVFALILLVCGASDAVYVGYHFKPYLAQIDQLSREESQIGMIIATRPDIKKVYTYFHSYLETLRYYSGHEKFEAITSDPGSSEAYFMIVPGEFLATTHLSERNDPHYKAEYTGDIIGLVSYKP